MNQISRRKAFFKTLGVNLLITATLITTVNVLSAISLSIWDEFSEEDIAAIAYDKNGHVDTLRAIFEPTDRLITRMRDGDISQRGVEITIATQTNTSSELSGLCDVATSPVPELPLDALSESENARLFSALPPEYQLRVKLPNQPENAPVIYTEELQLPKDYVPFRVWGRTKYSGKAHNYDENGFRIHKTLLEKPADAKNIGFFGGSTMEGFGVDDQGAIPARFDNLAANCKAKNFGVYSYNSRQSLETFINLINTGVRLDVVIFYDGINDVTESCKRDFSLNTHSQESIIRERLDFKPLSSNLTCHIDPERASLAAQVLIQNWRHAQAIAAANDIKFMAILQPVSFVGSPRTDHIEFEGTGFLDKGQRDQFLAVYPIVQSTIKELNLPWVLDFTDVLNSDEYLYLDFAHISKEGNQIIAERVLGLMN